MIDLEKEIVISVPLATTEFIKIDIYLIQLWDNITNTYVHIRTAYISTRFCTPVRNIAFCSHICIY